MKKTGKHIVTAFIALFSVFFAKAQNPSFYASVDKNPVATGDVFTYKVTLENGRGDISAPDLSDFNVVFGPSTSSSFRIINGSQTSSMTLSYSMRPIKTGTFTIGPASVDVNGKRLQTKSIEVKVVKGSSTTTNQSNSNSGQSIQTQSASKDNNLLVQVQLSKRQAYLGEQIIATYVILTRYRSIEIQETNFPTLPGFWSEDVKQDQASWEQNYTMINGVAYRKAIIKQQILFPQRTGELKIAPLSISARVNRSFFNPGSEVKVSSNSPTISVKELPGKAPDSYDGAVGNFTFSASLDRKEVNANDAINLTASISGRGNLTLVKEPEINFPADFETYDPETKDRITVNGAGVSGTRSFQYLIIPRYPGDYQIPAIHFTFFDASSGKFVTQDAGPFDIHVTGTASTNNTGGGSISQNTVKQSNEDIHYIETDASKLQPLGKKFFGTTLYYVLLGAPFLFFIGFIIFRKKREAEADDVVGTRRRKANKMARKRLKSAATALKNSDSKLFYAEIFKAIYGYMSDKLGIPGSLLSKQVIMENLRNKNVDEETLNELSRTLETCEMARFASSEKQGDQEFYNQTVTLIAKLDSKIR